MRATFLSTLFSLAASDILESTGCDLQQDGSCAAELLQVQAAKRTVVALQEIPPETIDEFGLCDADALDLSTAAVLHSNLGGAGPDSGEPTLIFGNVRPGVNLKISVTSSYTPNMLNPNGGVLRNGVHNGFGRINLAATPDNAANDLEFFFVDATTGAPVTMEPFVMTFFDSDHGGSEDSQEFITVYGFSSYKLAEHTNVIVSDITASSATFSSVLRGNKEDNPSSPFSLTPLQQKKSIALLFEGTNEFAVSLRASGFANPQGRNFFFAGKSAMVCGNRAKCSSHQCAAGALIAQAEFTLCAGSPCAPADDAICCANGGRVWIRDAPATFLWNEAAQLCTERFGSSFRVCNREEICPNGSPDGGQATHDSWVPVGNDDNQWIQTGTGWPTCELHTEIANGMYGKPAWGVSGGAGSTTPMIFKGDVCCAV